MLASIILLDRVNNAYCAEVFLDSLGQPITTLAANVDFVTVLYTVATLSPLLDITLSQH
jgi:hypothetical protein